MKKLNFQLTERGARALLFISALCNLAILTTARQDPWTVLALCAVAMWALALKLPDCVGLVMRGAKPGYLLAALAAGAFTGYTNFYSTWLRSDLMASLGSALHLGRSLTTLGISGCLILLAVPALAVLGGFLWEDLKESFPRSTGKGIGAPAAFAILTGVYAFSILAILRTDFNYIDDMGRVLLGYKEWQYFSRFLSAGLSSAVHMGGYLTDVSPLPQLLACAIMALASVALLTALLGRSRFSLWEILAVLPLGLNPYFLECISYKYDAPYMALSVFGAVVPLLLRGKKSYIAAVVAGMLILCTTYQAAAGIFPLLVIAVMLRAFRDGEDLKKIFTFCGVSAAGFVAGLLLFTLLIQRQDVTYFSTGLPPVSRIIPVFFGNLAAYYRLVVTDFKPFWLLLSLVLGAVFLWRMCLGRRKWQQCLPAAAAGIVFFLLLTFGVYPVLEVTQFDPRGMYGLGGLLAILAVTAAEGEGRPLCKLPALVLAWTFFVFTFTYGNALAVQKDYTDLRMAMVLEDLNDLDLPEREEPVRIELVGDAGFSPVLAGEITEFPVLERLVPRQFRGDWLWGVYEFVNYTDLRGMQWEEGNYIDFTDPASFDRVEEHMYHTIRIRDDVIQVELK